MPSHTQLKGVVEFGTPLLSEQMEANIASFFQWGMLNIGAFNNVYISSTGAYNDDFSKLRPVKNPYYDDGQVWEAYRSNWVWETGLDYHSEPIRVSGVYVDNVFHSIAETGSYAHKVNYPHGQIIFDTPISTGSVVRCEYSHRTCHFELGGAPWWKQIQSRSFRIEDDFLQWGSGVRSTLVQNRVQLPAVVVQVVPRTTKYGKQIGDLTHVTKQDVLFHVLAEEPFHRNQLHDIITYQKDKRIVMFDKTMMENAGTYGLNEVGDINPSGKMYPQLVEPTGDGGYAWKQLRMDNFSSVDTDQKVTAPLFYATIRGTMEVDTP